jgi:hypothetical protein
MIIEIQQSQFAERVLGIKLTPDQFCLMLEGKLPQNLKERIHSETMLYESFLDDLAARIGGIPSNIAKTFTDATSVLTFIYNVISDKTGQNLEKANLIITRNCKAIYTRVERFINQAPEKIKDILGKVVAWIKEKTKNTLSIKSDTDPSDDVSGEGSNWKKFLQLFLVGMVLVFLNQLPEILKKYGMDIAKQGLTKVWEMSQEMVTKFFSTPSDMLKMTTSGGMIKLFLPLIAVYKSAQILQAINNDLLDSNAWLKKT